MGKKRVRFVVEVDLDMFPGAYHTWTSWEEILRAMLKQSVPHYNPTVDHIGMAPKHGKGERVKLNKIVSDEQCVEVEQALASLAVLVFDLALDQTGWETINAIAEAYLLKGRDAVRIIKRTNREE